MKSVADIVCKDSESGVICSLFHHPEYILHFDKLKCTHFSIPSNIGIYAAIENLTVQGIFNIDPYNILESVQNSESTRKYASEITLEKLNELIDMSDTLARHTIEEYKMLANNVLETAFRRDMFQRLNECQRLCWEENEENRQQKIYQLIDEVMTTYSASEEIPQYKEVIDELWEEIKSRQGTGYAGIPFKFPALNDYVTIERGELVIFGAQQKVGKSIMLLNCAVDLLRQGYSVLYIDSELSSRLFTARLLSHLSGIEYRRLTSGNYSEDEEEKIIAAKEWMKQRNFTHLYMPFFDQQSIYTAVKKQNHVYPIDVVIIDYFKSTGNNTDAFQTYAEMGRCVDVIKNEIAGAMNIAAIGAAQATINNKLADSAKIARNASTIIMLMDKTPEELERDGVECGNKKLVVSINRNGMQHAEGEYIDMAFDGNKISYEQAAKQHVPNVPF